MEVIFEHGIISCAFLDLPDTSSNAFSDDYRRYGGVYKRKKKKEKQIKEKYYE
jgi:hypothetical protein